MKLLIFNGLKDLNKIESDWNLVYNSIPEPKYTQSIIWYKAYLNNLSSDPENCFFFCIYKQGHIVAIFPLELFKTKFYFLKLKALGFSNHPHFGISSVLVKHGEDVNELFQFLYINLKKARTISWDLIYFKQSIESTNISKCRINNSNRIFEDKAQNCDLLFTENYNHIFKKFSRNLKRNLRKGKEEIAKIDNVEYLSTNNCEELKELFNEFIEVEASGWKGESGERSAIKLDNKLTNFYKEVMLGYGKKGQAEINLLKVNGTAIAAQYAIVIEPSVFLLKIGYNENYYPLSPGNLLLDFKLKAYCQNPKIKYLNLISDAKWHYQWKPKVLSASRVYVCKNELITAYFSIVLGLKKLFRSRYLNKK